MKAEVSYRAKITWMVRGDDRLHSKIVNSVRTMPIIDAYDIIKSGKGVYNLRVETQRTTVEEIRLYR